MQFPRIEPQASIACGKRRCGATFFRTPGNKPFTIECSKKGCDHRTFVRGDEAAAVETAWRERLELVEA